VKYLSEGGGAGASGTGYDLTPQGMYRHIQLLGREVTTLFNCKNLFYEHYRADSPMQSVKNNRRKSFGDVTPGS